MLNNLNQFKWQITPNPNEKQRERERSIKYAAKKGNERGNLEGLINLREEIGRVMGQKGEECWECCLRLLRRYSSHQSHCCFHFSLSLSYYSLCLCVCVSVTLFLCMNECMYSFLPSFVKTQMKVHFVCLIRVSLAGTHCPATPTSTACFQIITLTLSILLFLISYLILSSKKFTSKT